MTTSDLIQETESEAIKQLEIEGYNAARKEGGPILLLAGPGTGKTHCLAFRIKWLVEEKGVDPDCITVITFTTEATINMRSRISDPSKPKVHVADEKQPKSIRTMHSLGFSIVKECYEDVGLKDDRPFVVTSNQLKEALFADAAYLAGLDRDSGIKALEYKGLGKVEPKDNDMMRIWTKYDEILRSCNAIDYDDQILLACKLLESNAGLLDSYQKASVHLLVDEYQDINEAQFRLICLLSATSRDGLFVVGDDDQSIYSFRGGNPIYIQNFEKDFGDGAKVLKLRVCRRCPKNVIHAANSVVENHNANRLPKPHPEFLESEDGFVYRINSPSQDEEAGKIANQIRNLPSGSDVMILVPTPNYAYPLKEALDRLHLGYESGLNVDIEGTSLLKTIFDWTDNPARNFDLRMILQAMVDSGLDIYDIPSPKVRKQDLKDVRHAKLNKISELWLPVLRDEKNLLDSLKDIARTPEASLMKQLLEGIEDISASKAKGLREFLNSLGEKLPPWNNPDGLQDEVDTIIREVKGQRKSTDIVNIRLMTFRKAKGLEASHVFVIGLEDGIIPKDEMSEDEKSEWSRLVFVAMTRSKKVLFLHHSRSRSGDITYGKTYQLERSRFICHIPGECVNDKYVPPKSKVKKKVKEV